ncbi:MAG: hypothetical protein RLZZ187_1514 [Pseudomonadota bacterium]
MTGCGLGHGGGWSRWRRTALLLSAASLGWAASVSGWPPSAALAQSTPAAVTPVPPMAEERLDQAQLEALLAPIALYPDELLMQVLMAATYPLEVVHARRWLGQGQNAALQGEALATALVSQPWDPAVKSLIPFPDVLIMMNDQLEWTQQLGDALLAQQEDVLNAVQVLRARAQAAGHLQSGPEQIVTVTAKEPGASGTTTIVVPPTQVIVIQPAQPNVVAVPVYNPSVVYGGWPYPATPPVYYPPPPAYGLGSALLTGMAFGAGVALVGSLWGWASPGWGRGSVDVNVNRHNNINVNRTQITNSAWRHDAAHRQGVAYRSPEVGNRYRPTATPAGAPADRARSREEFRGRTDQAARTGGADTRPSAADRAAAASRPSTGAERPGAGNRPPAGDATQRRATADAPARPATAPSGRPQPQQASAATRSAPRGLQGLGEGGQVRSAQQRGEASRSAASAPSRAAPAGGARGGGSRGGGGGGRGR